MQKQTIYDGPAGGDDRANALLLDNNGNVFVTGVSEGNGTGPDYATIGHDVDGNFSFVECLWCYLGIWYSFWI